MPSPTTLELAGEVHAFLTERGTRCLIIGALALAAHGYVRATQDIDLAVAVVPKKLKELARELREHFVDLSIELEMPSPEDPLGGVIDLIQESENGRSVVQIVNFDNSPGAGFPALVNNAVSTSFQLTPERKGDLVSPEDLVFFKLYAGGTKSRADIEELLVRCRIDEDRLWHLARSYRMTRELDEIFRET